MIYIICKYFVGKVYNITPYLEFHPGGIEELLKGAGIDSTTLFDQVSGFKIMFQLSLNFFCVHNTKNN